MTHLEFNRITRTYSVLYNLPEVLWYQEVFMGSFQFYSSGYGNSLMPYCYPGGTVDGTRIETHPASVSSQESITLWEGEPDAE